MLTTYTTKCSQLDGNFHTNIATDLWATMNENLTLASSTKYACYESALHNLTMLRSSILHILVMEKIINAIAGNISQMTNFAKVRCRNFLVIIK